jgi:hypothetical protein
MEYSHNMLMAFLELIATKGGMLKLRSLQYRPLGPGLVNRAHGKRTEDGFISEHITQNLYRPIDRNSDAVLAQNSSTRSMLNHS